MLYKQQQWELHFTVSGEAVKIRDYGFVVPTPSAPPVESDSLTESQPDGESGTSSEPTQNTGSEVPVGNIESSV